MSWMDQGRQVHAWFGHGTAPQAFVPLDQADRTEVRARITAVVEHAADLLKGNDPAALNQLRSSQTALKTMFPFLATGVSLKPDMFRQVFLGKSANPIEAWHIQKALFAITQADTYAALKGAGADLAAAVQSVGPTRWIDALAESQINARLQLAAHHRDTMDGLEGGSLIVPFSPANEQFASQTEKIARLLTDSFVEAATELFGHVFEDRAPGQPTTEDGYVPPKRWDGKKVRAPNGRGYGYPDEAGNVWVPTGVGGTGHRPHWDVQSPDGKTYTNRYPGGRER